MTLEDKIYQTLVNNPDTYPVQQCEKIADEFAIEFAEWLMDCHISELTLKEFKKEQGL